MSAAETSFQSIETIPPASIPFTIDSPNDGNPQIRYEDRLISRPTLARWFGLTTHCLSEWADRDYGPKPLRLGGYKLMYRIGDCLAFLATRLAADCPDIRRGKNTEFRKPDFRT